MKHDSLEQMIERRSFAWTATKDYRFYPQYVNLSGNRLAVRGPEVSGPDGHPQPGPYVAVDLPDEAIADLRATLADASQATETDVLRRALEPFALLAGGGVNMNDPLRKWFTVAHLQDAREALSQQEPTDG